MPELVMAIDAGTTGITVLVIDPETNVRGRSYSEFTQHFPQPGWVEHDATEIWDVTRSVMDRALADATVTSADIAAIGITNQRETTVLWDRTTGTPVAPAIVWQCRRSADICERLKSAGLEPPAADWTYEAFVRAARELTGDGRHGVVGVDPEGVRQRVAADLKTIFASKYTAEIGLAEALSLDVIRAYAKRATGEKYLIVPQRGL